MLKNLLCVSGVFNSMPKLILVLRAEVPSIKENWHPLATVHFSYKSVIV